MNNVKYSKKAHKIYQPEEQMNRAAIIHRLEKKLAEACDFWNERDFDLMMIEFLTIHDTFESFRTKKEFDIEKNDNFLAFDLLYIVSRIANLYLEDLSNFEHKFPKLWQEMKSGK